MTDLQPDNKIVLFTPGSLSNVDEVLQYGAGFSLAVIAMSVQSVRVNGSVFWGLVAG
jgi:hypothetical protein